MVNILTQALQPLIILHFHVNIMSTKLTKLTYTIEGEEPVELDLKKINCIEITGLVNGTQYKITLTATNANGSTSRQVVVRPTNVEAPTSNLQIYIDPDDVETSGSLITRINDPLFNDHFLSGRGQATLVSNAFNDQSAIRFSGDQSYFNSGERVSEFTDEATFYLVSSTKTAQKSSIIHSSEYDNGINIHLPYRLSSGADVVAWDFGDRSNGRLIDDWQSNFGSYYIWEFKVKSGRMEVWRNESLLYTLNSSSTVSFTDEIFVLGGRLVTDEDFFDGDILFLAGYSEFHEEESDARTSVLEYLTTRFDGITGAKPVITSITPQDESGDVFWEYIPGEPTFTLNSADSSLDVEVTDINTGNREITDYQYQLNDQSWVSAGSSDTFSITGLTNGVQYSVKVRAVNVIGVGIESPTSSETPIEVSAPDAPVIDAVNAKLKALEVEFTPPTGDVTGYKYRLDSGTAVDIGLVSSPYTITGLSGAVEYDVELLAYNDIGDGDWSNLVTETTEALITESSDYVTRVETDSGTVYNENTVNQFYVEETDNSRMASVRNAYAGTAGLKGTDPDISKVYDLSDNDNDATTVTAERDVDGFDMSAGFVTIGSGTQLTTWSAFAWVKVTGGDRNGILGQGFSRRGFELRTSSNIIAYEDNDSNFHSFGAGQDLDNGAWYMIGFSGTGNTLKGYVNGSLRGTKTVTSARLQPDRLGFSNQVGFNGLIDLSAIYTVVLTDTEFSDIYNATKSLYE